MTGCRRTIDMPAFLSLVLLTRFHDRGQWLRTPSWQTPEPQGGFLPCHRQAPGNGSSHERRDARERGTNMEPPEPCFIVLSLHHENRPEVGPTLRNAKRERFCPQRSEIKKRFERKSQARCGSAPTSCCSRCAGRVDLY
jgi:hypothetical protein